MPEEFQTTFRIQQKIIDVRLVYNKLLLSQGKLTIKYTRNPNTYKVIHGIITQGREIIDILNQLIRTINSYPHFFPDNPFNRYNTSKITQENIIRQYADIDLRDSTDDEEGRNQNHPLVKYLKEYNDLMGMDLTIPEFVVFIKHNKAKFTKK